MKVHEHKRRSLAVVFAAATLLSASVSNLVERIQADELEQRRQQLDAMSAEEKDALRRKKQRFDRLPEAEQQRMRELHSTISSHENGDKLIDVLVRYNEWLKTLPSAERAKLLGLPADKRIEQIKLLRQQQVSKTYGLLGNKQEPPGDLAKLFLWVNMFVRRHESEIVAGLPKQVREQVALADPRRRQRMLLSAAIGLMGRRPGQRMPQPSFQEMAQLKDALSPQAKRILENEPDATRRIMMVQRWLQAAVLARQLPPIEDGELRRFFNEDLTDVEREKLDQLSQDQRQRQLRRLYYMRNRVGRGDFKPRVPD